MELSQISISDFMCADNREINETHESVFQEIEPVLKESIGVKMFDLDSGYSLHRFRDQLGDVILLYEETPVGVYLGELLTISPAHQGHRLSTPLILAAAKERDLPTQRKLSPAGEKALEAAWHVANKTRQDPWPLLDWLRTDEAEDVLASLRHLYISVKASKTDKTAWKWSILALHNALQGAMVCHLSGTSRTGCLTERSAKNWLDWYNVAREREDIKPPVERLADAKVLLKRLTTADERIEGGAGEVITISSSQAEAFLLLHELRNKFSHFTPQGWSIEISGLPDAFRKILALIETIGKDPWSFRHLDVDQKAQFNALITDIRAML